MVADEEAVIMRSCVEEELVRRQRVVAGVVVDQFRAKVGLFFWKEGLVLACRRTTAVVFVYMV